MSEPKLEVELKPCPFCGSDEHLEAGHVESMKFAVICTECRCRGPQWSYWNVVDDDGRLLPKFRKLVKGMKPQGAFNELDMYLLKRAVECWNNRGE